MLETQPLVIPFAGGIEEDVAAPHRRPMVLKSLVNAIFDKDGALATRPGVARPSDTTFTPKRIYAYQDSILGWDDTSGASGFGFYDANFGGCRNVDLPPVCIPTRRRILGDLKSGQVSAARSGQYMLEAHLDQDVSGNTALYFSTWNGDDGQFLCHRKLIATANYTTVFVLSAGVGFAIFAQNDGATQLEVYLVATGSTTATAGAVIPNVSNGVIARGAVSNDLNYALIVFQGNTAGSLLRIVRYNCTTGAVESTANKAEALNLILCNIAIGSTYAYIVWTVNNAGTYEVRHMTVQQTSGMTTGAAAGTALTDASGFTRAYAHAVTVPASSFVLVSQATSDFEFRSDRYSQATMAFQASIVYRANPVWSPFPIAPPFQASNGRSYILTYMPDDTDGCYILEDLHLDDASDYPTVPAAYLMARRVPSTSLTYPAGLLPIVTGTQVRMLVLGAEVAGGTSYDAWMYLLDFNHPNLGKVVELGGLGYVLGGFVHVWDGARLFEVAPFLPLAISASAVAAGGALADGTYRYQGHYFYVDAQGLRHRSGVRALTSVSLAGGVQHPQLTLYHTAITRFQEGTGKHPPIYLHVFRTKVGVSTPIYKMLEATTVDFRNNTTTGSQTYDDRNTDVAIGDNPILYTDGDPSPLMAQLPPAAVDACVYRDRVFLLADDEQTLFYSTKADGEFAPRFHDLLQWPVFDDGSKVTAIASDGLKLYVWKRRALYAIQGDGADEAGFGCSLTEPEKLSDVGCVDSRSVVGTPAGIFFQSEQGIHRVTDSVDFVGAPVRDLLASFPTIVDSCWHEKLGLVLFACNGGASGRILAYDVRRDRWTSWSIPGIANGSQTFIFQSLTVSDGTLFGTGWTSSDGYVFFLEDTATSIDWGTRAVPITVELADVQLPGIMGYQRVRRISLLAEKQTSASVSMEVANDYASSYYLTRSFAAATIDAFTSLPRVQLKIAPSRQRCEAVRLKVTMTPSVTSTGRGHRLLGVRLDLGVKPGAFRLQGPTERG